MFFVMPHRARLSPARHEPCKAKQSEKSRDLRNRAVRTMRIDNHTYIQCQEEACAIATPMATAHHIDPAPARVRSKSQAQLCKPLICILYVCI